MIVRPAATEFGVEWAVLELLTGRPAPPERPDLLMELLGSQALHVGKLLEQAMRQKMAYFLAAYVESRDVPAFREPALRESLGTLLSANRYRTAFLREEAARVADALRRRNVTFACTKGIIFESALYHSDGSRAMRDIDFMIRPEDRPTAVAVMSELGFRAGRYNSRTREIELDRRTELLYRLNPDHLPHFSRLTDNVILPCVMVDFANSFTWTNSPWQIPMDRCLADLREHSMPNRSFVLPRLAAPFELLFTVLHVFREAWLQQTEGAGLEVDLVRFADVLHCFTTQQAELEGGKFRELVEEFALDQPVVWVLEHLDRTLGTDIVSRLDLAGRASEEWLGSAQAPGGHELTWRGTMRQRLHDPERPVFHVSREPARPRP